MQGCGQSRSFTALCKVTHFGSFGRAAARHNVHNPHARPYAAHGAFSECQASQSPWAEKKSKSWPAAVLFDLDNLASENELPPYP
jgi:hypothetical protein